MSCLISCKVWEPLKTHRIKKTSFPIIRDECKTLVKCDIRDVNHKIDEDDHLALVGTWRGKHKFAVSSYLNITKSKFYGNNPFFPAAVSLGWFVITAVVLDAFHLREYIWYGIIAPVMLFSFLSWKYRVVTHMLNHFDKYNALNWGDGSQICKTPKQQPVRLAKVWDNEPLTWDEFEMQELEELDKGSGNYYGAFLDLHPSFRNSDPFSDSVFGDDPFSNDPF